MVPVIWDKANNPNFISALKGHIKSVISSTFRKKEQRLKTKTLEPADEEGQELIIVDDTTDQLNLIETKETLELDLYHCWQ